VLTIADRMLICNEIRLILPTQPQSKEAIETFH
jgi:hypothetical protein